jgi:hypothetical protein
MRGFVAGRLADRRIYGNEIETKYTATNYSNERVAG